MNRKVNRENCLGDFSEPVTKEKDAMGVQNWIPLDDRHHKTIAEYFLTILLAHTKNAETPADE